MERYKLYKISQDDTNNDYKAKTESNFDKK